MDVDYDYDADPFADLDYDDLVKWAAEHRLDKFHFRWLIIKKSRVTYPNRVIFQPSKLGLILE